MKNQKNKKKEAPKKVVKISGGIVHEMKYDGVIGWRKSSSNTHNVP